MAATLTNKIETYKQYEFVCDTATDLSDLPTTSTGGSGTLSYITEPIKPGSTAFVIADSSVYMLGSDGEWTEIQGGDIL